MKQIIVMREFQGYPDGDDKAPVTFAVTDTAVDVPAEFAEMVIGKGLARAAEGSSDMRAPHEAE